MIGQGPGVDPSALADAVAEACRVMNFHGGGIRLVDVTEAGAVEVQFEGLCVGCPIRPVTLYGTIVPLIAEVPGVTSVQARGVRISEESVATLMDGLADGGPVTATTGGAR